MARQLGNRMRCMETRNGLLNTKLSEGIWPKKEKSIKHVSVSPTCERVSYVGTHTLEHVCF